MKFDVRDYIYKNGRLLERKLYGRIFEDKLGFSKALIAYQNEDGGFGNGIEPDLLCPSSSMIGVETALYYMDISGIEKEPIIKDVLEWLVKYVDKDEDKRFPKAEILDYPHQPWWGNNDEARVFSIFALLKKHGAEHPELEALLVDRFRNIKLPERLSFYDYVYYNFIRYVLKDQKLLDKCVLDFEKLLVTDKDHYPLFSRHWYSMMDYMEKEVVINQFSYFLDGIHLDDEIRMPYPDLPWWTPIMMLDGLLIADKYGVMGEEDE